MTTFGGRRRVNWPDLLLGVFMVAVAAIVFAATRKLSFGTAANMGPAYMPRAVAWIILGFGVYFTGSGVLRPFEGIPAPRLRPVFWVLLATAVFAAVLLEFGLLVAAALAIVIAGFASPETRPVENIGFGLVIAGASVLLFVTALKLPVPIWPW